MTRGVRRNSAPQRSDRGVASIEVVGLLPVVALVVSMILQLAAAAYTSNAAESAAREAARAYSLGENPDTAARNSLPGVIQTVSIDVHGPHHTATVTVRIPRTSVLPLHDVTKTVVMP